MKSIGTNHLQDILPSRIVLTTHAKNQRAIRCYLACGFLEEGRPRKVLWIEGEYVDLVNMSILREEFDERNK